jgi:hypothetical protein
MKTTSIVVSAVSVLFGLLLGTSGAVAQETRDSSPSKPETTLTAREKKFQETLRESLFTGRWAFIKEGKLSEEQEEKYTILRAVKTGEDRWIIYARVQYGSRDLTVPVPVDLKWAGETPVITLDSVSIPGLGTYSARVLVHEKTYAGSWSASDHGGVLYGVIEKQQR